MLCNVQYKVNTLAKVLTHKENVDWFVFSHCSIMDYS